MRTLHTSAVVLAALLAAVVEFFGGVALFAAFVAVGFVRFCLWKLCTRINIRNHKNKLLLLLTAKFIYLCVAVTLRVVTLDYQLPLFTVTTDFQYSSSSSTRSQHTST